jgi:ribonuclease HII
MKRQSFLTAKFELDLIKNSDYKRVIGIDEVGRGCWAGPTAVGFYAITDDHQHIDKVIDSKKLSKKNRDLVYSELVRSNPSVIPLSHKVEGWSDGSVTTVAFGEIESINKLGIGKTITNLISNFVEANDDGETYFLIDGQFAKNFGPHSKKIIKGDLNY